MLDENRPKTLAETYFRHKDKVYRISTALTSDNGWETMIFPANSFTSEFKINYETKEEALIGHAKALLGFVQ